MAGEGMTGLDPQQFFLVVYAGILCGTRGSCMSQPKSGAHGPWENLNGLTLL